MGLIGKAVGALFLVAVGFVVVPKILTDVDVNGMMQQVPGADLLGFDGDVDGALSAFGPAPVRPTQAHAIVQGGQVVHVEFVLEQIANRTFALDEAVWLVDGLDASEWRETLRDADQSMFDGQTTKGDLWRAHVASEGWAAGTLQVSLHLAEQAGIQWTVEVPASLEDGRVPLELTRAA